MIGFAGVVIGLTVQASRPAAVGRHRLRLRGRDPGRLPQRPDRGEDAAAVLHRHAGLAVHPARPVDRHHPRRHRPHPDPLHPRRRARSRHGQPLQRHIFSGFFHWMGDAGLDRHAQRRRALRHRRPDVDRLVARAHGAGRLRADPDPLRQLDLRHRRRRRRRPQCRRAGRPGEDQPVHLHRLRGHACWPPSRSWRRARPTRRAACSRNSRRSSRRSSAACCSPAATARSTACCSGR